MKKSKLLAVAMVASAMVATGCAQKVCKDGEHVDNDPKDHLCDTCGVKISDHVDENKDHLCDTCGATISRCVDENKDHKCDTCGETLSHCWDDDKDHECDYCGESVGNCVDLDKNHECDVCGQPVQAGHVDTNPKDHYCDYCGELMDGGHVDTNPKDHNCDYCGQPIDQGHVDANKDHTCDYCGEGVDEGCVDTNLDQVCDYCGQKLAGVGKVTVKSPMTAIGVNESVVMTSDVIAFNNSKDVTWSTESSLVTLTNVVGGGVRVTAGAEVGEAVIKATSVANAERVGEFTLTVAEWDSTSKTRMKNIIGEVLPYFTTINGVSGSAYTGYKAQVDAAYEEEAFYALQNAGYLRYEENGSTIFAKESSSDYTASVLVTVTENKTSGLADFVLSKGAKVLGDFPVSAVKKAINGKTESELILPDDGTSFIVKTNDGSAVEIICDCDGAALMAKLRAAGYFINPDSTLTGYESYFLNASPERTLLYHVAYSAEGSTRIYITTQTIPTKSEWSSSDKSNITAICDWVVPFVNVGLSVNKTSGVITTSRVEALDMILAAYDALVGTEFDSKEADCQDIKNTSSGEVIPSTMYLHKLSQYEAVKVYVYRVGAKTTIMPVHVSLPCTTWETEYIASFCGEKTFGDVIPEPNGATQFGYIDQETFIQINVTGDFAAYIQQMRDAGYDLEESDGIYMGYSAHGTIFVNVAASSDTTFYILAMGQLKAGYSYEFPTANLLKELRLETADGLVIPTAGELFAYTRKGLADVDVEVLVGGDMTAFVTALGTAEFAETEPESGIYVKENVQITVTAGENGMYTINYTLLEKPVVQTDWNEEEKGLISTLLTQLGFTATSIPFPTTFGSAEIDTTTFGGPALIISGGNISEYFSQLQQAGFTTTTYYYSQYGCLFAFEDQYGSWLALGNLGNNSYVITGDWILFG